MKVVLLLLLLAGLAYCQFPHFGSSNFRTSNNFQQSARPSSDPNVHDISGGNKYHYSWEAKKGQVYSGDQAASYCRSLGQGWAAVAISSEQENSYIRKIFNQYPRLKYIWTGGRRQGSNSFRWSNGEPFGYTDWSHTGGRHKQPDNRDAPENCLAVLRNVYQDGLKWHDVACGHTKPVLCEKH